MGNICSTISVGCGGCCRRGAAAIGRRLIRLAEGDAAAVVPEQVQKVDDISHHQADLENNNLDIGEANIPPAVNCRPRRPEKPSVEESDSEIEDIPVEAFTRSLSQHRLHFDRNISILQRKKSMRDLSKVLSKLSLKEVE